MGAAWGAEKLHFEFLAARLIQNERFWAWKRPAGLRASILNFLPLD
jgi:hypothetical protein